MPEPLYLVPSKEKGLKGHNWIGTHHTDTLASDLPEEHKISPTLIQAFVL